MRKINISFFLVFLLVTSLFNLPVLGATSEIQVIVRGEALTLSNPPVIESGRTLVPMRDIFESLDAYIEWDGNTKTVTALKGNTSIKLKIGNKTAYLNDESIQLEVAAKIIDGKTFVPIRFISESLGANVDWNNSTKTVTISPNSSEELRGNTTGNISNGGFICEKDDWIYTSMYKKGLWKIKKDGSEKVQISENSVNYLNIVGDWIYYSSSFYLPEKDKLRLYKMKLDGSSVTRLSEDIVEYVNVVGDWIYYINVSDGNKPYKIRLDSKGERKISDLPMKYMIVDDGWIYFQKTSTDTLWKIRTNGSDSAELSYVYGSDMHITKAGNWLYFIGEGYDSGIYKVGIDGQNEELIVSGSIDSINYYDGWLYYNSTIQNLYKLKEDLSTRKTIGSGVEGSFQVTDNWVYYSEILTESGKEYRVNTEGSIKQRLDAEAPLKDILITLPKNQTYPAEPIVLSSTATGTTTLSAKEIAKNKDAVAFIKTFDENGEQLASGSGFNIKSNGIIVTNFHVISGASSITCTLNNNTEYKVDYLLNYNILKDIAILKLKDATNLPVVRLGDSDKIELAEDVVAIGNPLEFQNTVTTGIVSGIRNMFGIDYIQTSASISPGSSGGPLFNSYGDVIGITSMTILYSQNINFAVPINSVKKLFASACVIPLDSLNYYESSAEEFEPNNNLGTANEVIPNQSLEGSFIDNEDIDYYSFTLNKAGKISLFALSFDYMYSGSDSCKISMTLLDKDGNEICVSSEATEVDTVVQKITSDLKEGTYYILVKGTPAKKDSTSDFSGSSYTLQTFLED
ncbi:DUF5050 domain-containing protein [Acetivibrio cellulolyticus]|uniref:DUF5050 domain-containing protein n=1 Tax=Acetivibrio cellulolyticus TaxID=35830 RepID=UPI0001E2D8E6|nr:DUF5050 domain-containing protein [Acetivibrio cellulolyticus]